MFDDRWERVRSAFAAASEADVEQRPTVLDRECGDDPDLRREVESLLRASKQSMIGTGEGRRAAAGVAAQASPAREGPGTWIGPYRLVRPIGEGGFGTVHLAEQEQPVRRTVALKIIKLGMDTRQVIARFEAERQALAMMDHPHIARVFDAGETETGRPYFVMELVRGEPITAYCDTHRLSVRERLGLFVQVCHAVQHAHHKGVIHRDLKPSNILVAIHDGRPVPKVIDFGIAKATSARLTERTLVTEHRQLIGTPAYMSPEQAEMSGLDIDTRTDIYSLGVLLYELLTGTTPFDTTDLMKAGYGEIQRIIREEEPPRPSTRVSTLGESLSDVAVRRRTEPRALGALLRGDLDWIVIKTLEKDRTRRYETANALAMDVERHLSAEPVSAAPPSAAYRVRKFVRRHRVGVAAGTAIGAAVVLEVIAAAWGLASVMGANAQLRAERDAKAREAAKAEAVSGFLKDVLASADPAQSGKDVSTRQMLDEASDRIARGAFAREPLVEARLQATIGDMYRALGVYDQAEHLLNAALATQRPRLGEHSADTIRSMNAIAYLYWRQCRYDEAAALNTRVLERASAALGPEHHETLLALNLEAVLANVLGRSADAVVMHERLLETRRRLLGEEHPDTLHSMNNLAVSYFDVGRTADAAATFARVLEACRRTRGEEHPQTLLAMSNVADCDRKRGRLAEAAAGLEEVVRLRGKVLGPDHPDTLVSESILAGTYRDLGRYAKAVSLRERVLEGHRRTLGEESRYTLWAMSQLAFSYRDVGRYDEAQALLERVYDAGGPMPGGTEEEVEGSRLRSLASVAEARGRWAEAETMRRTFLESALRQTLRNDPLPVGAYGDLGMNLLRQGRFPNAQPVLRDAYGYLGLNLFHQGKFAEAEQALGESLRLADGTPCPPRYEWMRAYARCGLGGAMLRQAADPSLPLETRLHKLRTAEPLVVGAHERMENDPCVTPDEWPIAGAECKRSALELVVELYETWHQLEPGKGHDSTAARWRARVGAGDPPTPKHTVGGPDEGPVLQINGGGAPNGAPAWGAVMITPLGPADVQAGWIGSAGRTPTGVKGREP